MSESEAKKALTKTSKALKLSKQTVRRLQDHLNKRSPAEDFKNEGEAIKAVQEVFRYMGSVKGADATTTVLRAMMEELNKENRISI